MSLRVRFAGLVIAILFAFYFYPQEKSTPTAANATPPPMRTAAPTGRQARIYLDMSPLEISRLLKSKTDYQAQAIVAGYKGKWINVVGTVRDVSILGSSDEQIFVVVATASNDELTSTGLTFERSAYEAKLSVIKVGDSVAATCEFNYVRGADVLLKNCELRDGAMPPPR